MRKLVLGASLGIGLVALCACTEDPTLDRVGGSGSVAPDAQPNCSETQPDARPRSLPCEVEAVLRSSCQRCHRPPGELTACIDAKTCLSGPFPLKTWSDTHRVFGGSPVFELMNQAVATDYMPFQTTLVSPPVTPLDAQQKETLLAWTRSCAAPGSVNCIFDDAGQEGSEDAFAGDK